MSCAEESVPSEPTKWTKSGSSWSGPFLCNWGNRSSTQAQSILLQHLQERPVGIYTWHPWNPATLSRHQARPHGPTSSSWSPTLADFRLWRKPDTEEEVEWQLERILRAPQEARDREYPFPEDLIVDNLGAVDVSFPVLAKVAALDEALRLSGSYKLVPQLFCQFTLIFRVSQHGREVVTRWVVG